MLHEKARNETERDQIYINVTIVKDVSWQEAKDALDCVIILASSPVHWMHYAIAL